MIKSKLLTEIRFFRALFIYLRTLHITSSNLRLWNWWANKIRMKGEIEKRMLSTRVSTNVFRRKNQSVSYFVMIVDETQSKSLQHMKTTERSKKFRRENSSIHIQAYKFFSVLLNYTLIQYFCLSRLISQTGLWLVDSELFREQLGCIKFEKL